MWTKQEAVHNAPGREVVVVVVGSRTRGVVQRLLLRRRLGLKAGFLLRGEGDAEGPRLRAPLYVHLVMARFEGNGKFLRLLLILLVAKLIELLPLLLKLLLP